MRHLFLPALPVLGAAALGACELVLGDLPPIADVDAGVDAGTGGASCDGDHDGVLAAGLCGGTDCDDGDPKVYPGEPVYYATPSPNPAVGFDYDCSGSIERNPKLDKAVHCDAVSISKCDVDPGFLAMVPPPCGQAADWGTCKQQGLGCVNDVIEAMKVMTCK